MEPNENQLPVALPETLRRQFDQVERRLWRVETAMAVCCILAALAASLLTLFISDRLWDTPVWLRWTLLLLGWAGCVAAAWVWLRKWVVRRRDLRDLANLVQKTYRRLGDRLLGIVELAREQRHLSNFSPALYQAAIAQVAEEALACDFGASVSARPAKKWGALALTLGIALAGAALILPQASANSFWRWMAPGSNAPRYTLVDIEGIPSELVVPQGETFQIAAKVRYRAFWKPAQVKGMIRGQSAFAGTVQNGELRLSAPAQTEDRVLRVQVGDASRVVKILPRYRPALKELTASVDLPEYLQYTPQTETVRNGALTALEGSRIAFKGKITRPLLKAEMQDGHQTAVPLKLTGDEFASDAAPVEGTIQFSLNWRDVLGLTNAVPLRLAVQTQKDAPPSPDLPDMPHEVMMLASDVLDIRVLARDDFGVSDFGLMWDVFSDTPEAAASTATTEVKVQTASPHEKTAEKIFKWSPSRYHVPPDSAVEIQGYARDYLPQRERAKTPVYRIQVLSPEKHAEILRQQLESVMAQVEEVSRLQEKIVNNTRELKESSTLPDSQQAARLGQSQQEQAQNAANLESLAERGRRTLQEAIKNPLVPENSVRDFARTMKEWQQLSKGAMQEASQSLKSAQQNAASRSQDIAQALEKEQQALAQLQKQQSKSSESMDKLQTATFAQRLRRVGEIEGEAGGKLLESASETIGMLPNEVPTKAKELESTMAKGQEGVQKEADSLQKEISRFYERTQKTNYNQVSLEMKEAHINDELDTLIGMIRDNVAVQASGSLTNWGRRFREWGDKLEPPSSSGSGGSGSGQASKQKDMTKQLVALLRLRESQLTLRDQTRLLEEQKGADYADQAGKLRTAQNGLAQQLDTIHQDASVPSLDKPFGEAGEAMAQAETLLAKPQTDAATDEAQMKSAEVLSDLINLINEQAQRPPPGQSPQQSEGDASAEEMAFLTQMMKEADQNRAAHSPTGGFSATRGGTGSAASPVTGDVRNGAETSRTVNKAAGMPASSPAEFRDALENYFRALEKNGN